MQERHATSAAMATTPPSFASPFLVGILVALAGCTSSLYPEFSGDTKTFSMDSDQVGDDFEIQVHLPPGYDEDEALPVVYVLDGSVHSEPVAGMAEELDVDVIVVGIGYDDGISPVRRRRDYSPTADTNYVQSGGADEFFAFVQEDVIPRIEGDYMVDTNERTLMGHSQGGLAALYFAMEQDADAPVFTKIAAASPALWWDLGVMLDYEQDFAQSHADWPLEIYASVGEFDPVTIYGYTQEFLDRVEDREYTGLDLARDEHARMSHDNAWIAAYPDALEWLHAGD